MSLNLRLFLSVGLFSLLPLAAFCAGDAENGEARLRESLRGAMLQLRNAQTDLANAQSNQAAQADEIKSLKEQLALVRKNGAEDRVAAEKKAEEWKAKLAEQTSETARYREASEQWKVECEKASATAQATEVKRAQLFGDSIMLERQVADLRTKNAALYRLGRAILGRYEKLGLGEQFLAREPFVGRTRVALENLIQDYDDKLVDQRAKP
jgi:chromosome segregation ATPase